PRRPSELAPSELEREAARDVGRAHADRQEDVLVEVVAAAERPDEPRARLAPAEAPTVVPREPCGVREELRADLGERGPLLAEVELPVQSHRDPEAGAVDIATAGIACARFTVGTDEIEVEPEIQVDGV